MKTKPSAIKSLLAAALAASCLASYAAAPQKREMKFEKLRKEFADPPRAFRPAPLWVWNTRVTRADIDRMLGDFKAQGFGGAFVHPRPGLVTEYLSDEWFDLYKYSVEKGKELGLDIWIYDENSYPSGFAGGHVPAQMPESYDQGQGLALTKTALPPADAGKYFLCLKKEGGTFRDITADTGRYKDVPGEYYLYEKTYYGRSGWHGGYSYVDLLVEGVTEKFLDITMSGYEKTFGNELGPVIRGLFSDEPCIPSSGGVRWTPDLFEVFRKQWGYDLATSLPLLSEQTGDWKQVRHNYLETLTQMFVDRWAKPMSAYCDRKGMLWTGHYWEHDWPSMYQGGDNMAMYAWHQMPAIDMLFNQYNDQSPQAQFGNVRAVKELRSAANQTGCVRTLSETYGGGGWDETFRDFKRLGDWEYALGVNFMNQHLSHMTIAGARKYDYPPVFTRLSPWWEDYKVLNDYFARLSLVLSQGEQMNDILVLEPTTTIWLYYSYVMNDPRCMEIGSAFQRFFTTLEKAQAEYDLGSEHIIKDRGSVRGGKFVVGKRAYAKVVIPPMTENLNAGTFSLIRQFVEACNKLFNHCYGTGNPWDSAIQYRQTIVERDTLTTGDIRVSYHFVVAGDFDTRGMKLVAEQPGIWNVTFNGTPVEAAAPDTLLDSRFGIYPVGNLVRRGTNTVELSVSPMSIYAEIAPIYLFGDFVLESAGAGWIVREPAGKPALGSWKRQGLPFYSWDMAYGRDYDIDDPAAGYTLRLNAWEGTLARVCVNGRKAGIIAWQPYAFDLTPYLRKGRNRVEVQVVGSLKNLFGPHYSADKGIAGPWHWNNVPKQLPGSDYDQRDYGLLEDFEIVMTK